MFTELFSFSLPDFLSRILGIQEITIYSYAALIALGTLVAAIYTRWRAKKELGINNLSNTFFYCIFIAGFVGGKLFYYLQDPLLYLQNPSLMSDNFSGGFVFYGSFVVIIPYIIWYLKRHKIPVLPMLDIFAITTTIVHAIGRLGCFAAGCCYGSPTESGFGLVFPTAQNMAVHPTQLYESSMIFTIMLILLLVKKHQQFKGQVFLIYLMLYAFGRGILELFRGDERGYIIDNLLSHSQFIALCLISVSAYFYYKFYKQININTLNT
ncbi:prolipoprotein diacylglyceryl transferase [Bizionia algoritergicola]|uniref:Phosphatidylglycerol--prolipoprotein diacylglyceryl transferase n=1 Tax=Bizionia algoritergicola TaxID=291187 RepID=A0A5D0QT72_9FLAO|nr:prolipoprotein diacylglyceryl transferase [Bizionia algoritergicola]TYB72380.1 prolipoprotein diacylglyceryl transferase [Bizionia algoritergicola]